MEENANRKTKTMLRRCVCIKTVYVHRLVHLSSVGRRKIIVAAISFNISITTTRLGNENDNSKIMKNV